MSGTASPLARAGADRLEVAIRSQDWRGGGTAIDTLARAAFHAATSGDCGTIDYLAGTVHSARIDLQVDYGAADDDSDRALAQQLRGFARMLAAAQENRRDSRMADGFVIDRISETGWRVIFSLNSARGGLTGSRLAQQLDLSESTVSRALADLDSAGLVRRISHKRMRINNLTDAGRTVAAKPSDLGRRVRADLRPIANTNREIPLQVDTLNRETLDAINSMRSAIEALQESVNYVRRDVNSALISKQVSSLNLDAAPIGLPSERALRRSFQKESPEHEQNQPTSSVIHLFKAA